MIDNIRIGHDSYNDITTVNYTVDGGLHRLWYYGELNYKPNFYSSILYRIKLNHKLTYFTI